ncbi:MAG: hypothetical protein FIB01_06080 [Gemmatimonadetes bacterium]|nr:hypothetical protein [Gemmatimonadota bacterium]
MAERRPFLLRMDPEVYAALQRWAADDLRSLNAQIEFVLRRALREAGRLRGNDPVAPGEVSAGSGGAPGAAGPPGSAASAVPPAPDSLEGEGGG